MGWRSWGVVRERIAGATPAGAGAWVLLALTVCLAGGVDPPRAQAYFDGDACGGALLPGCVPYPGAMVAVDPGERSVTLFCNRTRETDDPQLAREAPGRGDGFARRNAADSLDGSSYAASARLELPSVLQPDSLCVSWRY